MSSNHPGKVKAGHYLIQLEQEPLPEGNNVFGKVKLGFIPV